MTELPGRVECMIQSLKLSPLQGLSCTEGWAVNRLLGDARVVEHVPGDRQTDPKL